MSMQYDESNDAYWFYLCRWHFYLARIFRHEIAWCDILEEDSGSTDFHCDWHGTCKRRPYREVFSERPIREILEVRNEGSASSPYIG